MWSFFVLFKMIEDSEELKLLQKFKQTFLKNMYQLIKNHNELTIC